MSKLMAKGAFFLAIAACGLPAAAQPPIGPHAAACHAGSNEAAILVNINGFKARTGNIRVQLYHANDEFLARGRWLQRVDIPVTRGGPMPVCITTPGPGRYAIAVRHDVDGNGSSGWNDGAGFSRNPDISLTNLKPNVSRVAFQVGPGVTPISVVLNYRFGLSIHPVRS